MAKQKPNRKRLSTSKPIPEAEVGQAASVQRNGIRWVSWIVIGTLLALAAVVAIVCLPDGTNEFERRRRAALSESASELHSVAEAPATSSGTTPLESDARYFTKGNLTMVWDTIEPSIKARITPISARSNIEPKDYAGPSACVRCHPENHQNWSDSSHRWMNAEAKQESVLGDFSGTAKMNYRGGVAQFYREDGKFMMRFDREDLVRVYEIRQTIGSRFYQYYVGQGRQGPEPPEHDYYREDFVLPFGYWLERKAWVPIVHVADELPEGERWDPVETVRPPKTEYSGMEEVGRSRGRVDHSQELALIYKQTCNYCHTTFPLADMFVRMPSQIGPTLPQRSVFELSDYVARSHPNIFDGSEPPEQFSSASIMDMTGTFISMDARDQAATLGVSCEACHLGCKEHAEEASKQPAFAPLNPNLLVFQDPHGLETGRSAQNINATCGRCHAGSRTTFAAGISTWNSTEHSDAMRGSCYSEMSCIDCHDPHKAIGKKWNKPPDEEDAACIRCHQEYTQPDFRALHTRHLPGSGGDQCMNCHMPHVNEGMQDVVRTHTIFSPTQPDMIEQNQPNACNLCHLEKSIDWTLSHLRLWYGREYSPEAIKASYSDPQAPVGLGWLQQEHEATRLVAAAAFARQNATWGLPHLAAILDDPYLLNRQFAQTSIESLLGKKLDQDFGYWYYMTKSERQPAIVQIKNALAE